jgi:hypothetical protein
MVHCRRIALMALGVWIGVAGELEAYAQDLRFEQPSGPFEIVVRARAEATQNVIEQIIRPLSVIKVFETASSAN